MLKATDPNEYVGLKGEMSMRIQLINTQENTALLMVAALWGASFALSSVATDYPNLETMSILLLYTPILLLIPISQKSGENLYQITVLSAYVKVFFEYTGTVGDNSNQHLFSWESVNRLTSKVTDKNNDSKLFSFFINNTYPTLAIVSLIFYIFKVASVLHNQLYMPTTWMRTVVFAVLWITIIAAVILIVKIYSFSSIKKNMQDPEEGIIKTFVEAAQTIGLIHDKKTDDIVRKIITSEAYRSKPSAK